jgi:hypothetical protein
MIQPVLNERPAVGLTSKSSHFVLACDGGHHAGLILSAAVVVLATIAVFVQIPFISNYAFWVAIIGYAVPAIGTAIFCL